MTDPLDTARARLARGEIDAEEYDRIAARLADRRDPRPASGAWGGLGQFVLRLVLILGGIAVLAFGVVFAGAAAAPQLSGLVLIVILGVVVLGILFLLWTHFLGGW